MAVSSGFPLLVEGSWGTEAPKNLKTKLQLYFQSSKKSGGGECEVHLEPGSPPCFLVVFSEEVRQRVLERGNHELVFPEEGTFKLTLKLPSATEKSQEAPKREIPKHESKEHVQQSGAPEEPNKRLCVNKESEKVEYSPENCASLSSLVVFENLKDDMTESMLSLLVENISCLSSDEFQVEIIRTLNVAMVAFKNHIDITKFVDDCAKHPRVKKVQLSARLLEGTKTIKVENLPPGIDDHLLRSFFESPHNGGGRVANVEYFPEKSSALVEFFDRKVLDSIMTRKLDLNHTPLSVFPYYPSLGTVSHGKKKPLSSLPAPFKEMLPLSVWKFLHKRKHLTEEINERMKQHHCELTWSKFNGEVTFRPAASLLSQGRNKIQTWQKDTSMAFNEIKSRYKVTLFKLDKAVWSKIKDDLHNSRFFLEFNAIQKRLYVVGKSEEMLTFEQEILNVVGNSADIQKVEQEIRESIETTNGEKERALPSVEARVAISPAKYSLLCLSGVLGHLRSECPKVEMSYKEATQCMCFKGLPADVYKVKHEIQVKVFGMVEKSLSVSPEVFKFLQEADSEEFSKSLFKAQKILAVYELNAPPTVLLTSCSPKVLFEAEKRMVSALSWRRIDVKHSKVVSGKKWKDLTSSLWRKYNSSSMTVLISVFTSESAAEVIIAGCVREVNEVYDSLSNFLEKHTKITELVTVEHSFVFHYLKDEMKSLWLIISKTQVHVTFNPEHQQNSILLTGPNTEVLEAINLVRQALDSVCFRIILIDKPGVRQFFQDNAQFCRTEVSSLFGCYVELLENKGDGNGQKCLFSTTLPSGVSLIVQQGDLTQFPVDVVVNATTEDLKHGGRLAATLLKAAGPELQEDCDQIVKMKGKIPTGSATISKAGRLPYRHVIHAVGPRWNQHEAQTCVDQLKNAVEQSLCLAEEHGYHSIAIPALTSGVRGFPLPQCVETIVLALKEHFQQKSDGHSLKEIYLVDAAEKTVEVFVKAVKKLLKGALPDPAFLPSLPVTTQSHMGRDDGNGGVLSTPEGLKILLVKGEVQNAVTDVVVNSIPLDLALDRGPLSQALLNKAGPKLQEELNRAGQAVTVDTGTILLTSGCNLNCSHVLHVVAPDWSKNSTFAYEIMEAIITECLDITQSLSLKTIAFPAIATGNLGFPKAIFAKLMISVVFNFSSKYQTTLQEVHLMLHPSDYENIQVFSDEFAKRTNGNFSSNKISRIEQGLYGAVSSPGTNVYEMKIGPITYQVAIGDITNEVADVIVNSVSRKINVNTGVSEAILRCAGEKVVTQYCHQAGQGNNVYIVTDGGLLKCKNIIHVFGGDDVKKSVASVLQECAKRNYSSLCLPAIGTGNAKQNPEKVAEDIMDAIKNFVHNGSIQSVRTVKVVIILRELLNVFYGKMKEREGSRDFHQQSVASETSHQSSVKQKPLVLEEKKESVSLVVCGPSVELVEKALSYIHGLIERRQLSYTNKDECIKDFDEKEYRELNELQRNLNIAISLDTNKSSIEVLGFGDVTHAKDKIEKMITMKRTKLYEKQGFWEEFISEHVEWQYGDNNTFYTLNKKDNMRLEEAWKAKKQTTEVKIYQQKYKVNLSTCTATSMHGHTLHIRRLIKSHGIPAHWSDMGQQKVLVVLLQPDHPEYITVASKFRQTCENFKIEKIERIQNTLLWNNYQERKRAMDAKNGEITNEKQLFHGTDADSVPHVNATGFNRSYAGKNATAFGKGTYFAVNANYSANDIYSKPDVNGKKYMYFVRVLTGIYATGMRSLIVPPPKNPQNPTDRYDTVTDNVQNPNLFVVFYDYQSYPEYLITFRK